MVFAIWTIQATDKHQMQTVINYPNMAAILIFQHINVSTMVLMDSLYLITYKEVFIYVPTTLSAKYMANMNFSRFSGGHFRFAKLKD